MAYITCHNLEIGYEGKPVAKNINFQVNKGDYLCITGENGTGKSTLIKTLLHLMEPLDGKMVIGDGLKSHEIGYLPQQTVIQKDFPASVWEVVLSGTLSGCGNRPYYSKTEKKIAIENMEKMGILDLKKKCYRNLSGGQQQRTLLARALCATTKLILLDEPATGLDPKGVAEFYQTIEQLNQEKTTIIMVSHDMQMAATYASHILHIEKEESFYGEKGDYMKSNGWKMFRQMEDRQ